jgi:hypothetical protein
MVDHGHDRHYDRDRGLTRAGGVGDRQGNNALWTIANNRLIHHPETRAYAARRTAEGLSRREILRCLKRHLARRLYRLIIADLTATANLDLMP